MLPEWGPNCPQMPGQREATLPRKPDETKVLPGTRTCPAGISVCEVVAFCGGWSHVPRVCEREADP